MDTTNEGTPRGTGYRIRNAIGGAHAYGAVSEFTRLSFAQYKAYFVRWYLSVSHNIFTTPEFSISCRIAVMSSPDATAISLSS